MNTKTFILPENTYTEYTNDIIYADEEYDSIVKSIKESNKGCLIQGSAGVGKTFLINKLINKLDLEDHQLLRLTPTNVSALLINGTTLDKFVYSFTSGGKTMSKKYSKIKYIFVDEISMVKCLFYQVLLTLKHFNPNIKFIISGDFYQLPPVMDKVQKEGIDDTKIYEYSRALFELVDGMKLTLNKCKRSDDTLYNLCEELKYGKNVNTLSFTNRSYESYKNVCHTND